MTLRRGRRNTMFPEMRDVVIPVNFPTSSDTTPLSSLPRARRGLLLGAQPSTDQSESPQNDNDGTNSEKQSDETLPLPGEQQTHEDFTVPLNDSTRTAPSQTPRVSDNRTVYTSFDASTAAAYRTSLKATLKPVSNHASTRTTTHPATSASASKSDSKSKSQPRSTSRTPMVHKIQSQWQPQRGSSVLGRKTTPYKPDGDRVRDSELSLDSRHESISSASQIGLRARPRSSSRDPVLVKYTLRSRDESTADVRSEVENEFQNAALLPPRNQHEYKQSATDQ